MRSHTDGMIAEMACQIGSTNADRFCVRVLRMARLLISRRRSVRWFRTFKVCCQFALLQVLKKEPKVEEA